MAKPEVTYGSLISNVATAFTGQPQLHAVIHAKGGLTEGTGLGDVIYGSQKADLILAGRGDDTVYGNGAHDVIDGGPGNDELHGGSDYDWLYGGLGDDTLDGGSGDDEIHGQEGNDILTGGIGADRFWFDLGDGDDVLTDYEISQDEFYFFGTDGAAVSATATTTAEGVLIEWGEGDPATWTDSLLLEGATFIDTGDFVNLSFI